MKPGKSGILFLSKAPHGHRRGRFAGPGARRSTGSTWPSARWRSSSTRSTTSAVSFNGEKLLYRQGEQWVTAGTGEPPAAGGEPKPGEGPLKLEAMQVLRRAARQWKQIYDETWRIERDFFYDPSHHGLDLGEDPRRNTPPTSRASRSRDDLTYLFEECPGRADGRPHVRRRGRPPRAARRSRAACSAPTTRSRTAATASPGSTTARTGTRASRRPSPSPA